MTESRPLDPVQLAQSLAMSPSITRQASLELIAMLHELVELPSRRARNPGLQP